MAAKPIKDAFSPKKFGSGIRWGETMWAEMCEQARKETEATGTTVTASDIARKAVHQYLAAVAKATR